jgi:hypothetical protein
MIRTAILCAPIALASACIMTEKLGDGETSNVTGDDDGPAPGTSNGGMEATSASGGEAGSHTSANDTDGVSMTATMASEEGSSASTSTGEAWEESGTGDVICVDMWMPPIEACEPRGEAHADVEGPELDPVDAQCEITSIESASTTTDIVTFDCGVLYELAFTTSNPHLELPLSVGEEITLQPSRSYGDASDPATFVVRSMSGALLLMWINNDRSNFGYQEANGFNLRPGESGCDGFMPIACDGGGDIVQRQPLAFFDFEDPIEEVFDGNYALVPFEGGEVSVIVDHAEGVACRDAECTAPDDERPQSEFRALLVVEPNE